MKTESKTIIENYWEAANNRDWKTFESFLSEHLVYELPQTRERIRGRSAFREFNQTYPGNWTLMVVRLVVEEDRAVSQISFFDNDEEQTGISFFEIQNGLIHRIIEYWPSPYDPPFRNAKSIERY